jgi:hypothetical protein
MERVAGGAAPRVCLASSFDARFGERDGAGKAEIPSARTNATGSVPEPCFDTDQRLTSSRRALIATITVDSDMRTAPAAGVRRMPIGYSTPAATGIASAL